VAVVDCGRAHLFEITGSADMSGTYPSGAALPDPQSWQHIAQLICLTSVTSYLGQLDPYGMYGVAALKPTAQQWAGGARLLRCGIQRTTRSGELVQTTGSAKGADQSNVYPVGTCLALVNGGAGGPAPCGNAHSYEIVGIVDLHGKFPASYPAVADQQTALGALCAPVAAAYTNGFPLASDGLTATWDTIKQESWAAGSFKVNCKVGAELPDGSGLSPVTNSIKGVGHGTGTPAPPASPPPTGG
jgi:hypothetical protein